MEVGSVAFVIDTSVMYIYTDDGWIPAVVRRFSFFIIL